MAVGGPSGDVARPLLRKNVRHDAYLEMGARGAAMKLPAPGSSAAVSENYFSPEASLPPLVLLPVSDLGSVDLHPCRPRTEKSNRKSRVNLGQSEVRKNRTEPAPQTSRGTGERQHHSQRKLQSCSDQIRGSMRNRDCTQAPRGTRKVVTPRAYLLSSRRDTGQLEG